MSGPKKKHQSKKNSACGIRTRAYFALRSKVWALADWATETTDAVELENSFNISYLISEQYIDREKRWLHTEYYSGTERASMPSEHGQRPPNNNLQKDC